MIFQGSYDLEMIKAQKKTQTRRINKGVYQIGRSYAVQLKRGAKAEPGIRIVMDKIWEESEAEVIIDERYPRMGRICISTKDALAEGGYTPLEYELEFEKLYPIWDGKSRWVFEFHAVEAQK